MTPGQVYCESLHAAMGTELHLKLNIWDDLDPDIQAAHEQAASDLIDWHNRMLVEHLTALGQALGPMARVALVTVKSILMNWIGAK